MANAKSHSVTIKIGSAATQTSSKQQSSYTIPPYYLSVPAQAPMQAFSQNTSYIPGNTSQDYKMFQQPWYQNPPQPLLSRSPIVPPMLSWTNQQTFRLGSQEPLILVPQQTHLHTYSAQHQEINSMSAQSLHLASKKSLTSKPRLHSMQQQNVYSTNRQTFNLALHQTVISTQQSLHSVQQQTFSTSQQLLSSISTTQETLQPRPKKPLKSKPEKPLKSKPEKPSKSLQTSHSKQQTPLDSELKQTLHSTSQQTLHIPPNKPLKSKAKQACVRNVSKHKQLNSAPRKTLDSTSQQTLQSAPKKPLKSKQQKPLKSKPKESCSRNVSKQKHSAKMFLENNDAIENHNLVEYNDYNYNEDYNYIESYNCVDNGWY